jgi:hypothetical protein
MFKLPVLKPILVNHTRGRFDFLGSVISAGASLIGGVLGNKASAKEAAEGRQHSDYQLQNRHQWEAEDLRKAGRNPILYSSTTPSTGASPIAQQQNPLGDAVNSAIQAKRAEAEIKNLKADTKKKESEADTADNLGALYAQNYRIGTAKEAQAKVERDWFKGRTGRFSTALDKLNPLKFFGSANN